VDNITGDDKKRVEMLSFVSKKGLKSLGIEDLVLLRDLVEKKDYSHSKKAQKSKMKLLAQINARIFDLEEKK